MNKLCKKECDQAQLKKYSESLKFTTKISEKIAKQSYLQSSRSAKTICVHQNLPSGCLTPGVIDVKKSTGVINGS